jgi:MoaA/NifB/PqqE/SkfB family radical SAM enzyme
MSRFSDIVCNIRQVNVKACVNAAVNYCEGRFGKPKPLSLPVSLDIILTKACNLKCSFCVSYGSLKDQRWLPFQLYERIARKLFPSALGVFLCSGGEPLLYPKIREALQLARKYETLTTMTTNGMLLDSETAKWIVQDQCLHELCISFDGARKETLERIRRGADYDTILANIEHLFLLKRRQGLRFPRLWLRYVIMRSNAEELPEIFGLCSRYGLQEVQVKYLNASNDIEFSESLFNHRELAALVFAEARRKAKESAVRLRLPPLPGCDTRPLRCMYPWQFCQIDTDGSLRFCYQAWQQRLGFFEDGFERIWREGAYRKIRRTMNSDTPYFPYCRYCSARNGFNWESSHDQRMHAESYVIPGLEDLQVPFRQRTEENVSSFKELRKGGGDSPGAGR